MSLNPIVWYAELRYWWRRRRMRRLVEKGQIDI